MKTTTIHQRFELMIKGLGVSKNAFAKSLGVASTQIYNIVNRRNAPSFDLMAKIITVYPAVNVAWLLVGNGPMLNGNPQTQEDGKDLLGKIKTIEEQLAKLSNTVAGNKKEDDTLAQIKNLLSGEQG